MTFTQQLLLMTLVYTGAGTIIYGLFGIFYWIKNRLEEKREFDEEQIELIVQKAKFQTLKELEKRNKTCKYNEEKD